MRPKIPTQKEVIEFFKLASAKELDFVQRSLFGLSDESDTLVPPRNEYALVLFTLITKDVDFELTNKHWINKYDSTKWSSRLSELEKKLQVTLVKRTWKTKVNYFGRTKGYKVYENIHEKKYLIELYNKINL